MSYMHTHIHTYMHTYTHTYKTSPDIHNYHVTGFAKGGLILTKIFNSLYLKNAQSCLCAFLHWSIASNSKPFSGRTLQ